MTKLILYDDYSREDVHDIFSPDTPFTPQAGTWGLQGYVVIPNRPRDFVFYVTFGQQQGTHTFDEGITEEGVLSWQSQPRQGFRNDKIKQWINHDELTNSIYLFLRTNRTRNYTYMGMLKYLSHDTEREYPVYFQWQILDWNISNTILNRMGLRLQPAILPINNVTPNVNTGYLNKTLPPSSRLRVGTSTHTFQSFKVKDYSIDDAKNKILGRNGELLVVEYEKKLLIELGRNDLAQKVRHVSEIEGDGAGYDIQSFLPDGKLKYIEVKNTYGLIGTPFFMSINEINFSKQHSAQYYLYRVYEYNKAMNTGKFYEVHGDVEELFTLTPIQYRVCR